MKDTDLISPIIMLIYGIIISIVGLTSNNDVLFACGAVNIAISLVTIYTIVIIKDYIKEEIEKLKKENKDLQK